MGLPGRRRLPGAWPCLLVSTTESAPGGTPDPTLSTWQVLILIFQLATEGWVPCPLEINLDLGLLVMPSKPRHAEL